MRCEDYPCCGHTDGLPCDWTYNAAARQYDMEHATCDHEAGFCDVIWQDDEDDEDYCDPATCGVDANYNKAYKMWLCAWCGRQVEAPDGWNPETEEFEYED